MNLYITNLIPKKKRFSNESLFLILAVWTGLEPATPCVTGMYSNQLNYQTNINFFLSKLDQKSYSQLSEKLFIGLTTKP